MEQALTQLQMMLIKQAGPGLLPLTFLFPEDVLKFLRKAEQAILDSSFAPVFVYWSRHNANRLLPNEHKYRELMRDAFCLAVFSKKKWNFLMNGAFWLKAKIFVNCMRPTVARPANNRPLSMRGIP